MDPRRALSFGAVAATYDRSRPGYPAEAVRWVVGTDRPLRVLDVGAGTGKLTAALLGLGHEVVAVEPDDAMRALVPPAAEVLAGTAEQLPLPVGCVDAVVAGQAFHWFDVDRALPEMVRVLRPGGSVGLLWNVLDDDVPWVSDLCDLSGPADRASYLRMAEEPPFDGPAVGLTVPERLLVEHAQDVDADLLVDNLRSRSQIIVQGEAEREDLLRQARALAPAGRFPLPYVCGAWRSVRA
ncbi:MAG: class SAM-dependent methyltransferase [Frankiales bacterium]|jgi:SAM-dependent methyltransferase|nr:class SAM-dependent methyltransferase [Frankiales bacterium]